MHVFFCAIADTLVYVEHDLQELGEEVHVIWEPLLVVDHHPRDEEGDLAEGGEGVEGYFLSRPHPLIYDPRQRLQHLHIL